VSHDPSKIIADLLKTAALININVETMIFFKDSIDSSKEQHLLEIYIFLY